MNSEFAPTEAQVGFMKMAIELAMENVKSNAGGPFGAIVVRDGMVIAKGTNLVTSSLDPTAHAEVVAIREACQKLDTFQLSGCDIYTSCEPCPMCLGAIYWARPERVFFGALPADAADAGFDDQYIYEEIRLLPQDRSIPMHNLLAEAARSPFELWKQKEDKKSY